MLDPLKKVSALQQNIENFRIGAYISTLLCRSEIHLENDFQLSSMP